MKISYRWLGEYIDGTLPAPERVADAIIMHSFEIESMENVGDDTIFDVKVLPNRSHDCLSYIGIAREAAVLFGLKTKLPSFEFSGESDVSVANSLSLHDPDKNLVRRALKRLAIDVTVGPSPQWLKDKLEAIGQRSINNVVDATNFVMWETGQPVHAFDFDKIKGVEDPNSKFKSPKEIQIRLAKDGEKITTLDGKEFTLDETMLVIADSDKALDIAGIKGGVASGIDANTKRVLLSSCTFHPTSIRRTSRKLNLLTDASKRFEQELSPVLAEHGMNRLSQILKDIAGARVSADMIDFYPRVRRPYVIGVSTQEVNGLLGTSMTDQEVESILTRLGFEWKKTKPAEEMVRLAPTLTGVPYKYAASISYDAPEAFDCSSLVSYLHNQAGFAIPRITLDQFVFGASVDEKNLMPGDVVFTKRHDTHEVHEFERIADGKTVIQHVQKTEIKELGNKGEGELYHNGLYMGDGQVIHAAGLWHRGEVVIEKIAESPAFTNIVGYRRLYTDNKDRYVVTVPPERLDLHAGPGFMISGTTADIIEEIGRVLGYENIAPQALLEIPVPIVNKTFYYSNKVRDILVDSGFSEVMTYAFREEGEVELKNALSKDKKYLRNSLSGGLSEALTLNAHNSALWGVYDYDGIKVFEIGSVFTHKKEFIQLGILSTKKGEILEIFKHIGSVLGEPISGIQKDSDIEGEIDLTEYIKKLPNPGTLSDLSPIKPLSEKFKPISQYPFVLRDIAAKTRVLEAENPEEKLKDLVNRYGQSEILRDVRPFDVYQMKGGDTSVAAHLVFQSDTTTLTDEEVNKEMEKIYKGLDSENWEVR